ncbi:hypothetical protein, partial [Porphyromonas sp.]|uniref:hypothetical protein n=1 Tax=Porphyromonas sp. TaxID=1924944 RepID=UPI0025F736A3
VFTPFLSYPRSGQRFFEAVRFSFAVAKIEQKLNTNQIFTQNISQHRPVSCIHLPVSKRVTRGKKISFSWGRWAISWGKNEGIERGRGALGGGMKGE